MKNINSIKQSKCDCRPLHQEKLDIAIKSLKRFKNHKGLSEFFKNFSDVTRVKILTILDKVGQMCVNDIAVALDMTKSAISHQLSTLKECKLVKSDKMGKAVFYSLSDDHVKDIIEKGIEHLQEKTK